MSDADKEAHAPRKKEDQRMSEPSKPSNIPAVTTGEEQRGRPFQPGVSGNPNGRPLGSRHKLSEKFIADLSEVWEADGKDALKRAMAEHPEQIVKVVAGLLPKDVNLKTAEGDAFLEMLGHFNDMHRAAKAARDAEAKAARDADSPSTLHS